MDETIVKTNLANTRLTRGVSRSWLSASILVAVLLLTWTGQLRAQPPFHCQANAGVPPIVRADGTTELVADVVLNCTGGIPTPAGAPVPMDDIYISLNVNVTSRVVGSNGLSEATLMIDESLPPRAARVPDSTVFVPVGSPPPQVLCMPQGSPCPIMGDGAGTPYETIPGTPTVYSGKPSLLGPTMNDPASLKWTVAIDAPGNATRVIRITNVRANAFQLGSASTIVPTQIVMFVAITGQQQITMYDPQQTVAFIETGMIVGGTSGSGLQCVSQNMPLSGPNFNITVKEGFASSFKRRNVAVTSDGTTAPAPQPQNIPGYPYNSETGFYNPALFPQPPPSQPGLADYGTRIRITFTDIPAGVNVFVPLQVSLNVTATLPSTPQPPPNPVPQGITQGLMVLIQSDQYGVSAGSGYAAVTMVAGLSGGVPVAAISPSTIPGQGYAVYEVVNTDVNATEMATIPVSVAFATNAGSGLIKASVSFAPAGGALANIQTSDPAAPVPRFGDHSVPRSVCSVGDCSPGGVTIAMVPFDGAVLVDGVLQSTPYMTHWTPGSMHTLSVASPIYLGPGQRQAFANWSDVGAQAHTVTMPTGPVLYQANFILQYKLTASITPAGTGTVVTNPLSPDGFFAAGTPVQLTASPAAGYDFSGWEVLTTMNPLTLTLNSPLFVTAVFAVTPPSRTWISGSGDDANYPCTRAAPCKTFTQANYVTAPGGEIDCLDPGEFGPILIYKAITIDCGGSNTGFPSSSLDQFRSDTSGIVVQAGAGDKVTLRNINFQGAGLDLSGIQFLSGAYLHIEGVNISGFQNGITVNNPAFALMTVRNSVISDIGQAGIDVAYPGFGAAALDNVQISNAATGVHAGTNAKVILTRSTIMGSQAGTSVGVNADASGATVNIDSTLIAFCSVGISASGGGNATLGNSSINNNSTGVSGNVSSFGGSTNSFFNNTSNGVFGGGTVNLK